MRGHGAFALYRRPTGATRARDIEHRHARGSQLTGNRDRKPIAHLFHHYRHMQRLDGLMNGVDNPAPVAIAPVLERLLQRVEVNNQRICRQGLYGTSGIVDTPWPGDLRRTEVGHQHHVRGKGSQFSRQAIIRLALQRHALRANPHRQPQRLCSEGQMLIDLARPAGAAGHRADQQRRVEGSAKQPGREIDVIKMQFRQGTVSEAPFFKAVSTLFCARCAVQYDIEMIAFTLRQAAH